MILAGCLVRSVWEQVSTKGITPFEVLLQKAKKLPCLNYIKSVNMEDNLTLFPEHLSLTQQLPLFDLLLWYMNFLIYFLMCFRA